MGLHVATIDIGSPKQNNIGWAIHDNENLIAEGADLDACVENLANVLINVSLALGFEAPMFVPIRDASQTLTKARDGDCKGGINRPFSAGAGAAALVTGLVVVLYVLQRLRQKVPGASATFDWREYLEGRKLLLFEAFVSNQNRSKADHIADAKAAVRAFQLGMKSPNTFESAINEPACLNLIGAVLLRTGWTSDIAILSQPCLVVRG